MHFICQRLVSLPQITESLRVLDERLCLHSAPNHRIHAVLQQILNIIPHGIGGRIRKAQIPREYQSRIINDE